MAFDPAGAPTLSPIASPSNSADGPFRARLEASAALLPPTLRRVAMYLAASPERAVTASANAIAVACETSDASVIRAIRLLGYAGMIEFKRALAQELATPVLADAEAAMEQTLRRVAARRESVLDHVLGLHLDGLRSLREPAFETAFARAAALISRARRLHIFGVGPTAALAQYLVLQLRRIGLDTHALTQTGGGLADALLAIGPGDVVLLFVYGRLSAEAKAVLHAARSAGVVGDEGGANQAAAVIAITDDLVHRLQDEVAVLLPCPRSHGGGVSLHGVTLAMLEALILALAESQGDAGLANLSRLNGLRRMLDAEPAGGGLRHRPRMVRKTEG
jgi:DNA-binding MurR/RpiR family transcriptional regulator